MTKITDPVEIAEELSKWYNKEVTAYVNVNPYVEFAMKSKLTKTVSGSWRVQLGIQAAATAIIFTARGVTDLRLQENGDLHININLATPEATGEFS